MRLMSVCGLTNQLKLVMIKMNNILVSVKNLTTAFKMGCRYTTVIDDVSFDIYKNEALGIVGESGSGKSVTAKSIMRLNPVTVSKVLNGKILYDGTQDVLELSEKEMCSYRGNKISMIFQEPMSSLNPIMTCGNQIGEAIMLHQKLSKKEAREKSIDILQKTGMPSPEKRIDSYPHELSGGMRQRVMIAIALSCGPHLLIADEPTTALDPTIQAQILDLIRGIQTKANMSVLYITHDLGVVAEMCQRIIIMYCGCIMEIADTYDLFTDPLHPYSQGLLSAIPKMNEDKEWLHNIKGTVPHFTEIPQGCVFCTRCPEACDSCRDTRPKLTKIGERREVACHRVIHRLRRDQ